MWQLSTTSKEDAERGFKKTSAIFAMFGDELVGCLNKLQFTEFAVVGVHKACNEHLGRKWLGEKVECHIEQAPDPANPIQNKRWLVAEGKKLGVFRSESAQLPIGTSFKAEIISPPSASIIITSTKGNQLKVGQLKKYAFPNQEWHGEEGVVTISLSGSGKALTPIALVSDQPLGVIDKESFSVLSEKLIAHGRKIQGFQFHATLESAPATIANIKLEPESIQYPKVWVTEQPLVKETKLSYLEELNTLLKQKYQNKNNQGLLHDDEAYLGAVRLNDEYFKVFMQQRGQNSESIKAIADEIERQLGGESFIGVAQKGNIEEIYFCITIPTERSQEQTAAKITDTFKFLLEYDQLENGQRTKFIAIPVDELQEIISQTHKLTATSSNLSQKLNNQEINLKLPNTDQQDLKKAHAEDVSTPQAVQREDWEKLMLKDAMLSLKANPANTGEEIQTATFAQNKYRVVYYSPLETLRIVDEVGHRGTLYKAQKGQSAQVCQFSEDEKKSFQQESQQYHCRDLQQE